MAESTCGSFLRAIKKRFGVLPGISDHAYITNSFHVPVYFKTTAVHKVDVESPYHALCNAGAITYLEYDGDPHGTLPVEISLAPRPLRLIAELEASNA